MQKKFIVLVAVFFLILGTAMIARSHLFQPKVKGISDSNPFTPPTPTPANMVSDSLENGTPFSILLLGYGGGNHEGGYLTDSMMIVRIDPKAKAITLISIPRDLWVNIPDNSYGGQYGKINSAYAIGMDDKNYPDKPADYRGKDGGGNLVKKTAEDITGIRINRFFAMDFSSFVNAVDALGGVDAAVETAFDDPAYPIDGKETDFCGISSADASVSAKIILPDSLPTIFPCRYENLHFDAGTAHLDGTTALKFVRSRHSPVDGSDFTRSTRQRNFLTALRKKVMTLAVIPKIVPLYLSLAGHIQTDIAMEEISTALSARTVLASYSVASVALTEENVLVHALSADNQYILVPRSGQNNWGSVKTWLQNQMSQPTPTPIPN